MFSGPKAHSTSSPRGTSASFGVATSEKGPRSPCGIWSVERQAWRLRLRLRPRPQEPQTRWDPGGSLYPDMVGRSAECNDMSSKWPNAGSPSLGLSKAGEVVSTWAVLCRPLQARVGLVQRRRHGLRLPSHVKQSTATSCTRSRPPFHSTQLACSRSHSISRLLVA